MVKWASRKLLVALGVMSTAVGVPVLYKHMEISDLITTTVLFIVGAVGIVYGGLNVLEKLWIGKSNVNP
jgi:hypothetical protein